MQELYKIFIQNGNVNIELISGVPVEVTKFLELYNKAISKVNLKNSILNIECIRLATPNGKDMKRVMKPCVLLYKATGFKEINVIVCRAQKCFKYNIDELIKELDINNMKVSFTDNINGIFNKKDGRLL